MEKIRVDASAFLWWAIIILMLPLTWVLSVLIAAFFHELSHYLAIRLLGGKIYCISIRHSGAEMVTGPMTPVKELLCALAGPLGGAVLICIGQYLPMVAVCAFAQTAFNLLPVYPLDGGRALFCLIRLLFPDCDAEGICRWVSILVLGLLGVAGIWTGFYYGLGIGVGFPLFLLLGKVLPRKRPCKTAPQRLQ